MSDKRGSKRRMRALFVEFADRLSEELGLDDDDTREAAPAEVEAEPVKPAKARRAPRRPAAQPAAPVSDLARARARSLLKRAGVRLGG